VSYRGCGRSWKRPNGGEELKILRNYNTRSSGSVTLSPHSTRRRPLMDDVGDVRHQAITAGADAIEAIVDELEAVTAERDWLRARVAWLRRAYTELNITRHGLAEVLDSTQRGWQEEARKRHNVEAERDRLRGRMAHIVGAVVPDGTFGDVDIAGMVEDVVTERDRLEADLDALTAYVKPIKAERGRLQHIVDNWSMDGAEYRHALDHVVDCTEGCEQCRNLAQETLDRTTMGKPKAADG
jgi:predicted nuclease with TOPRIM domain